MIFSIIVTIRKDIYVASIKWTTLYNGSPPENQSSVNHSLARLTRLFLTTFSRWISRTEESIAT